MTARPTLAPAALLSLLAAGCAGPAQPEVSPAVHHDRSAPLLLMPVAEPLPRRAEHEVKRIPRPASPPSSAEPRAAPAAPTLLMPTTARNFDGVGQGFSGPAGSFAVHAAPPDTNGDVGPNHYVQLVNTDLAIFDKAGTAVFGPVRLRTLWNGFVPSASCPADPACGCQTNDDGDPIVLYDPIADRWLVSQFSVTGADGSTAKPFLECVAVSASPDPLGAWHRYAFAYSLFPDYPKLGVWPDAYYATYNMFSGAGFTTFAGGRACALDRAAMLAGRSATQQCFDVAPGGLLPADLDGSLPPPAGSPNPVVALGSSTTTLDHWKFHVDWTTPANSTFSGPTALTVPSYAQACGSSGTCIPQPGGNDLDSLSDRLMFRLAYRNFADGHQSLVTNHSVTVGSGVGVRWYELRLDGSHDPSLFQSGTYAPDASSRWMGSIAQDQQGNAALGFSLSSSTLKPEIRYTGRLAGDAAGTMGQGEGSIVAGNGVQVGGSPLLGRWGDYSNLAVDPADDCTFWFTTEYIPADGTFNWRTRIGSFRFPSCGVDFALSAAPSALTIPQGFSGHSALGTSVLGSPGTVGLAAAVAPAGAGVTTALDAASVAAGAGATLTVSAAATAATGSYTVTVIGTEGAVSHAAAVAVIVTSVAATAPRASGGCGCGAGGAGPLALLPFALLALAARRRRTAARR